MPMIVAILALSVLGILAGLALRRCLRCPDAPPELPTTSPRPSPMPIIPTVLLVLGFAWSLFAMLAMLDHNPNGEFCRPIPSTTGVDLAAAGDSCRVGMTELGRLLWRGPGVMLVVMIAPLAIIGWLMVHLARLLEYAALRWFGRRPFD